MRRLLPTTVRGRILLAVILLNVVSTAVRTTWLYVESRQAVIRALDGKLLQGTIMVARSWGSEFHGKVLNGSELSDTEYRRAMVLTSRYAKDLGLTYLYTMIRRGSRVLFVLQSATDEEIAAEDYGQFLEIYPDPPPALTASFDDGQSRFAEYTDVFGRFRSVFVPYTTSDGQTYVIGADISMGEVRHRVRQQLMISVLSGTALLLVYLAFILVCLNRITGPLGTVSRYAEELTRNNFTASPELHAQMVRIQVGRCDEAGVLADSIIQMEDALQRYIAELQEALRTIREYNESLEAMVADKTKELNQRNQELERSLQQLREAQDQLIVQERLASLGSLTAGIAHEIKNPLNFVNNFAQLATGLVQELEEELTKLAPQADESSRSAITDILEDLRTNVTKINEHGLRADRIVKGMLQHARGSTGERRPVDLNQLVDEYVNLGYHSMRGQDATFNVSIERDFDSAVGMLSVVPEDLSRVVLNLVNNAYDALNTRQKQQREGYQPVLRVVTCDHGNSVTIRIWDNGTGMPQSVREKVFDPFFTTKPAGKGTGLGLSISYDIVTQGHQGSLSVDSVQGEYTEFTISLPRPAGRANGHSGEGDAP